MDLGMDLGLGGMAGNTGTATMANLVEVTSGERLTGVRDRLAAEEAGNWDVTVPLADLSLHEGRLVFQEARNDEREFEQGLSLSSWAAGQLCERLSIPAEFFRRNPAALQDAMANHWMRARREGSDREQHWLVRAKGGTARGILSPRYAAIDHLPLLDALLPLLPESRYRVKLFHLSPETWHLRVIDNTLVREAQPGDPLFLGFDLMNSEVGGCAVSLSACLWRQVCGNGMVRLVGQKGLLYVRHVGKVPVDRLGGKLSEALAESVLVGAAFLEQMLMTTRIPIHSIENAVETVAEEWRLPKHTVETAKWVLLREKPQDTLFALVNALTQSAQQLSPMERVRVETLAAALVEGATKGMVLAGSGTNMISRILSASKGAAA